MNGDRDNFKADLIELNEYLNIIGEQKKRVEQDISTLTEEKNKLFGRNSDEDMKKFTVLLEELSELDFNQTGNSTTGSIVINKALQPLFNTGMKLMGENHKSTLVRS